jgi:hypothetical protein
MRRGSSELATLAWRARPGRFSGYLIRSSWTVRLLLVMPLLVLVPAGVRMIPIAGLLYYLAMLWRFRFARAYPEYRAAWWIAPLVKLAMDAGHEMGRLKYLFARTGA